MLTEIYIEALLVDEELTELAKRPAVHGIVSDHSESLDKSECHDLVGRPGVTSVMLDGCFYENALNAAGNA